MLPTTTDYFQATHIAEVIQQVMLGELKLEAPSKYWLVEDGQFHWLIAVMDAQNLKHPIGRYTNDGVRHQLSTATGGLPVALSNSSGIRFGVLLSGKPKLPKSVPFEIGKVKRDEMAFGVGLRGEVSLPARRIVNMIIGGSQGSGKSMMLRMLAHTARSQGAKLYLADPMANTFNPDVWNSIAAGEVAGSRAEVLGLIGKLHAEVEDRSVRFRLAAQTNGGIPAEDIQAYNKMVGADEQLERIWFFGDEMNTYLTDKSVQEGMADLARVGRKWGIHVVLAAHNWRSEDIPRGLSAMFPTRLCLRVADGTSGKVTLDDHPWGTRAMRFRTPGRAVLRTNRFETLQLFYVSPEQEAEWLAGVNVPAPIPEEEIELVRRALAEADGKMSIPLLVGWGMTERKARSLVEAYEKRGWLEQDPSLGNARVVKQKLADLVSKRQTGQTASSPQMWGQGGVKPCQAINMGLT